MECPICLSEMSGENTVQVHCCRKTFHLECIVKCFSTKLECPMCRAPHTSISTQVVENKMVLVQNNQNFFRNSFMATIVLSIVTVSLGQYWG